MKDNREMIERALGPSYKKVPHYGQSSRPLYYQSELDLDALAEQAIVIEAKIIQAAHLVSKAPYTEIHLDADGLDEYSETYIIVPGHPLPEGKALCIIVSLEGKDD